MYEGNRPGVCATAPLAVSCASPDGSGRVCRCIPVCLLPRREQPEAVLARSGQCSVDGATSSRWRWCAVGHTVRRRPYTRGELNEASRTPGVGCAVRGRGSPLFRGACRAEGTPAIGAESVCNGAPVMLRFMKFHLAASTWRAYIPCLYVMDTKQAGKQEPVAVAVRPCSRSIGVPPDGTDGIACESRLAGCAVWHTVPAHVDAAARPCSGSWPSHRRVQRTGCRASW